MDLILIRMNIRICMRLQEILFMERKTEMSQEEKYKLALFAVIRNSTVMPQGVKLGKTMHEINTMAVAVMANIMESCDYEKLKESYESGQI